MLPRYDAFAPLHAMDRHGNTKWRRQKKILGVARFIKIKHV
jgi:hypothetical protein